jgi:hypothetical protein
MLCATGPRVAAAQRIVHAVPIGHGVSLAGREGGTGMGGHARTYFRVAGLSMVGVNYELSLPPPHSPLLMLSRQATVGVYAGRYGSGWHKL